MFIEAKDTTYMAEQIDSGHQRFLRVFGLRSLEELPRAVELGRGSLLAQPGNEACPQGSDHQAPLHTKRGHAHGNAAQPNHPTMSCRRSTE